MISRARTTRFLLTLLLFSAACASSGRRIGPVDGGTDSGGGLDSGRPDTATPSDGGGTDSRAVDTSVPPLCEGVDCSAMDGICQVGVCNPADGSCSAQAATDGTSCDDGDACTASDVCTSGTCAGTAIDCSAMDGPCAVGMCDSADGSCMATAMDDGTACDDGDACTTGDMCTAGSCGGATTDCSAMDGPCATGTCSPTDGSCMATVMADGTSCDDGDACTTGDMCTGGTCAGMSGACTGGALVPGRTDLVATRDGWSVRCLAWSGRTCTHAQATMECTVCSLYANCGMWHDISTFNDGGQRCSKSFCGLATGLGTVNSTGTGGTAMAPRACGWGSTVHPICETVRASYHPPVTGVDSTYGLLLNESYCSADSTLRTFDCAGW